MPLALTEFWALLQLGSASAIQKHSPAITSVLNSNSGTLTYGDLVRAYAYAYASCASEPYVAV